MKMRIFGMTFMAVLLSSAGWGAPVISPSTTVSILSGGRIILVTVPKAVRDAISNSQTWLMQPLLPPGAISVVAGPPEMFAHIERPRIGLHAAPEKVPTHCAFCVPVNPKDFIIAIVPVNPNIDAMGGTGHIVSP